jgi:hypothetical protein
MKAVPQSGIGNKIMALILHLTWPTKRGHVAHATSQVFGIKGTGAFAFHPPNQFQL